MPRRAHAGMRAFIRPPEREPSRRHACRPRLKVEHLGWPRGLDGRARSRACGPTALGRPTPGCGCRKALEEVEGKVPVPERGQQQSVLIILVCGHWHADPVLRQQLAYRALSVTSERSPLER